MHNKFAADHWEGKCNIKRALWDDCGMCGTRDPLEDLQDLWSKENKLCVLELVQEAVLLREWKSLY